MDKTVILSSNDNLDYLGYLPWVQKAWNILGWKTLTLYLGSKTIDSDPLNKIKYINNINGYRPATIVQVARLLGFKDLDGLIMTSDVDMMPLSNYWNPDPSILTVYGADLMNYTEYPMCYIAAPSSLWAKLFPEDSLEQLLGTYPNAKSLEFGEWWSTDQKIVTSRINSMMEYNSDSIAFRDRGQKRHWWMRRGKLAYGRVDRLKWLLTLNTWDKKIDAHMPRPFDRNAAAYILNKYHNTKLMPRR